MYLQEFNDRYNDPFSRIFGLTDFINFTHRRLNSGEAKSQNLGESFTFLTKV